MVHSVHSGFFGHRTPVPPRETVVLSEATRYMCAAAYLDGEYAKQVLAELLDDEHRAVVPSVGVDLGPVMNHCLRAQRLLLARHAMLTGVLLLGLILTPVLVWIGVAVVIGLGHLLWSFGRKLTVNWSVVLAALLLGGGAVLILLIRWGLWGAGFGGSGLGGSGLGGTDSDGSDGFVPDSTAGTGSDGGSAVGLLLRVGLILALAVATFMWWRLSTYRILTGDLAHGQRHRLPAVPAGRVRNRLETVIAAQWGNLTLHAHRNPFLGAGPVIHSWSMSVELRRLDGDPASIDPVKLHQHVSRQLLAMRGEALPEQERISGLMVIDHIVATGERSLPDPLVDPAGRVPYAEASPAAIQAIIRHPQGSLRYYLQTIVGAEGRDIRVDDRLVAPAQDQEIAVSTFLYLAVEGGMLYVEFVATVLPPIRQAFHAIDRLVPERIVGRSFGEALVGCLAATPAAPLRLVQALGEVLGGPRRMDRADRASREYRVYDYGARRSIRELVGEPGPQTYLQKLDAGKYYKLVERAITSAVLEFLETEQVDTSEYRNRTTTVLNSGVMIFGGTVTGPVAAGAGAQATATTTTTGAVPRPSVPVES